MSLRALARAVRPAAAAAFRAPVRALATKIPGTDGGIPTDADQQGGRRMEELAFEAEGKELFSREPITPPDGAGTAENPILVKSGNADRVVGYEDPDCHQLHWFVLKEGPNHYLPALKLFFKLDRDHLPTPGAPEGGAH